MNKLNESNLAADEIKDISPKYNVSKFDFDLYHEEDDVANPIIRIKIVSMPNKGQKWKILNDTKLIFAIESTKISKKERTFLQTIEGFNFILNQAKLGIKSLNGFKKELKKMLNKKPVPKPRKKK